MHQVSEVLHGDQVRGVPLERLLEGLAFPVLLGCLEDLDRVSLDETGWPRGGLGFLGTAAS